MWRAGSTRYILIGLLIIGLFILTRAPGWQSGQSFFRKVIGPVLTTGYVWGQDIVNDEADTQLDIEMTLQQQVDILTRENTQLRSELGLKPVEGLKTTAVEVVGRRQDETAVSYLVNRGSGDGIRPGLAVVSHGILVGTVLRVTPTSSEVVLLTSPVNTVTAEVVNESASRGVAQGEFNLALRLDLIPAGEELKIGDYVITSGLDELIPRGLPIGKVVSVSFNEGDFFKSAVLVAPFDLTKARFLQIILR